jgi:hypothetical protein
LFSFLGFECGLLYCFSCHDFLLVTYRQWRTNWFVYIHTQSDSTLFKPSNKRVLWQSALLLTLWSRVLHEKLRNASLVMKIPIFYGTQG